MVVDENGRRFGEGNAVLPQVGFGFLRIPLDLHSLTVWTNVFQVKEAASRTAAPYSGRVIGVVNMGLLKSNRETALSQPSGITYAIPVRHALALLGGRQPTVP